MAELLITTTDGETVRHPIGDAPEVIGRDAACDIPLDDPSASRHHARFSMTPRGCMIEDLGSKNGTLVNDAPCASHVLSEGDRILIGSTLAVFSEGATRAGTKTSPTVVIADDDTSDRETRYVSRATRLALSQRRLEMIYELSERLTTLQSLDLLLSDALSICFETLGFERGAIGVRHPDRRTLDWPVVRNLRSPEGELTISRTLLSRALEHGERAMFTADDGASADPTISIVQHGIRSAMCVPLIHGDQTLGVIYGDRQSTSASHSEEDIDFLAGIARQVSIGIINCRLVEEQRKMAKLAYDMDLARTIQTGLFPTALPDNDRIRVAALNDPGNRVSGDYYDVMETPSGRVWCLIADVTGEGVAAALLVANLQAAVRVTIERCDDPGTLMGQWNKLVVRNTDASKFITCMLALIDPATHEIRFATAGHCAPLIIRSQGAPEPMEAAESTFPLGVVEEAEFQTISVSLGAEPFVLLSYTDGVIEAMNTEGEVYGMERLRTVVANRQEIDPQAMIREVRRSVTDFAGGARQSDDITILAAHIL